MTDPLGHLLNGATLDHIAMVVFDRDAAAARYERFSTAPFERLDYANTALIRGRPCSYRLNMALGPLSPTLDLEIIELAEGDHPLHREFLERGGEGIQHIAWQVEDFDASIAAFTEAGFPPILQKHGDGTPVSIYMDTTGVGGTITELIRKGFRLTDPATWPKDLRASEPDGDPGEAPRHAARSRGEIPK